MQEDQTIRLLVIDPSSNEAEKHVSMLRNAGMPVRAHHVSNRSELESALDAQPWDLLLTRSESGDLAASDSLEMIQQRERDIPVVILMDRPGEQDVIDALRAGAAFVLAPEQSELLQLVLARELRELHGRRSHRRCQGALRESEKRCRSLLDSSRDAIAYVHEGLHVYANRVYLQLFGYDSFEDMEGMPVMDLIAPSDRDGFKRFFREQSDGKSTEEIYPFRGVRADEAEFDATMEFAKASIDGEPCTQLVLRQRRAGDALEHELRTLRKQDLLTGLLNRESFLETVDQAIDASHRAEGSSLALLYLELDDPGRVAGTVGLSGMDIIRNDIASLLKAHLGADTTLGRVGETGFGILFKDIAPDAARDGAEELRDRLEQHISDVSGHSVSTPCSIGLVILGEQTRNAHEALENAHKACASAVAAGGNRVELFVSGGGLATAESDATLVGQLREALQAGGFSLAFQPIVSLRGLDTEYYQVLLRLESGEGNLMPAGSFLPVAERTGMMLELDRWVVGEAVRVLAEQRNAGFQTRFFVTLAEDTVRDESFCPWFSSLLKEHRLAGDTIVFQLKDSVATSYLNPARKLIAQLRELHCTIALTHFGTGINPFGSLKLLEVDFLTLDPSITAELRKSAEGRETFKSLVDSVHAQGKLVIVPHIETAAEMAIMWQSGANFAQGNFLQEPSEWLAYDFNTETLA